MLKYKLNIAVLFIAALVIISLTNITALADELPDLNAKGTITITMKKDGRAVPGGEFEIYHIANVSEENGNLKYTFTNDFKGCSASLDNFESDEFDFAVEDYIKSKKISGIRKNVNNNGTAEFTQLEPGIYFVKQNEAAEGYSKANSFTVSLPSYENGKYNYTVNANPKFSFGNAETTTENIKPTKPADTLLPKTGQLNLPVPILTAAGLCMLASGLIIRFGGRKDNNEN